MGVVRRFREEGGVRTAFVEQGREAVGSVLLLDVDCELAGALDDRNEVENIGLIVGESPTCVPAASSSKPNAQTKVRVGVNPFSMRAVTACLGSPMPVRADRLKNLRGNLQRCDEV